MESFFPSPIAFFVLQKGIEGGCTVKYETAAGTARGQKCVSRRTRHVARIFERGGLLASEASKLRQGCGGG